jgi:UDP-GlcNAc3NAcA epimerase
LKIVTVIGARPQFIKAAILSRELKKHSFIEEVVIHTGQHFDKNMSQVFFDEMNIDLPKYNLGIHSMSHQEMTTEMVVKIEEILKNEKPDSVIVYGDTNSTLAGAIAASNSRIPLAHIEAGLRSYNEKMPEEYNRVETDRLSTILFCPTQKAMDNLIAENYATKECEIVFSGDVMLDAAMYYAQFSNQKSNILRDQKIEPGFILCTIHREENTINLERLKLLLDAINELSRTFNIVFPIHPRTKKIIEEHNLYCDAKIIDPVGYFDLIELVNACDLVMTDSGGLQKEAFFFNKPCVTLRSETEWTELVDAGFNKLAIESKTKIVEAAIEMIKLEIINPPLLYGDGKSCERIVAKLIEYLR